MPKEWYTPKEAMIFFPHLKKEEPTQIRQWIRDGKLKAKVLFAKSKDKHARRYIIHVSDLKKMLETL